MIRSRRRRIACHVAPAVLVLAALPMHRAHAACTFSVAVANFGTQTGAASTPGGTPLTVRCPLASAWQIGINTGLHGSGANYNWNLQNGTDSTLLNYAWYRDAARTQYAGGSVGYDTITGTGTGASQTAYLYPAIPANSAVTPGSYTDSLSVTLYNIGGNITRTVSVSGVVYANCTLSASPLAFGTYTGQQATTTTSLSVACTNTTTYNILADSGLYSTGGVYSRRLSGPGGAYLSYQITQDAAHTQSWGGTVGTDTVAGTGTGTAQSVPVYAQLYASQYVQPGAYSDTLTFTVQY